MKETNIVVIPKTCSRYTCKALNNPKLSFEEQCTNIDGVYFFCSTFCRTAAFEITKGPQYKKDTHFIEIPRKKKSCFKEEEELEEEPVKKPAPKKVTGNTK